MNSDHTVFWENVLLCSNQMDSAAEQVVLGTHGKNVMAGIFRRQNGEWLAMHEPFVIPQSAPGTLTFDAVVNHPALREKLQNGAQLKELLVGDGGTPVTAGPQKTLESIALFYLARANDLPAFPVATQTVVTVNLASDGVTAGVVEGDADGIQRVISNEVWPSEKLPPAWNVAASILKSVAPKELHQDRELLAEVQRQVDSYLQERSTFDQTPEMELVLPRLAPYGKITFPIPDTVFEQAVTVMRAGLEMELQGRLDHDKPVFLFVTGERANWPGVSEFSLPGRVITMVVPSLTVDPLALGAVLSAAPKAPALAVDVNLQVTHGNLTAELINIGSVREGQPAPQDLKVKFTQTAKDQPVEALLTFVVLQANGSRRKQTVHLCLPAQGQGWKIFQRGETPLATQEVTLSIAADRTLMENAVLLNIKMNG